MHLPALAVYGTLAPGESNAAVMAGMAGTWTHGTVRGRRHDSGVGAATGYPGVVLQPAPEAGPAVDVPVRLFTSADLPAHLERLDAFEGPGYRRTTVLVTLQDGTRRPAWIYELAPDAVPPAA